MDKKRAKAVREFLNEQIDKMPLEAFGVTAALGSGRFDAAGEITFRLIVREHGCLDQKQRDLDAEPGGACQPFRKVERGDEVWVNRQRMEVWGYNARAQKFPVIVQDKDGKRFKMSRAGVAAAANEWEAREAQAGGVPLGSDRHGIGWSADVA